MSFRPALYALAAVVAIAIVGGLVFSAVEHVSVGAGLYWAEATTTTVGYGDVTPKDPAGRWVAAVLMLSSIPLYSAAVAFWIAWMTAGGLHLKLDHIIRHHPSIPDLPEQKETP